MEETYYLLVIDTADGWNYISQINNKNNPSKREIVPTESFEEALIFTDLEECKYIQELFIDELSVQILDINF